MISLQSIPLFVFAMCLYGCTDSKSSEIASIPVDAGIDASLDATLGDSSISAMDATERPDAEAIQSQDAALEDSDVQGLVERCQTGESARNTEEIRVVNCRLFRPEGTHAPLRGVVVSADGLSDALSSSPHDQAHFGQLKAAGVDLVWLLVTWKGLQPVRGNYDGAYMGRICGLGEAAHRAGLKIILGGYHSGQGVTTNDGLPRWITEDGGSLYATWSRIWRSQADGLQIGWQRLLNTCEGRFELLGIQVLTSPMSNSPAMDASIVRGVFDAVYATARSLFGPVIRFMEPLYGSNGAAVVFWDLNTPDLVFAPALWETGQGPGAGIDGSRVADLVRQSQDIGLPLWIRAQAADSVETQDAHWAQLQQHGVGFAVWHDGFGSQYSIRDEEGLPTALWSNAFDRPWPRLLTGRNISFENQDATWTLSWDSDTAELELIKVYVGPDRRAHQVDHRITGIQDFGSAYDPSTEEMTIFLQAPAGRRQITISE